MPRLKPQLSQLARPIPRRIIAQDPAKQKVLEFARCAVGGGKDTFCARIEEAYF
jgi:hypothetical protein